MKVCSGDIERKILAYIGARGGSKRLKRKNMRKLGGRTLIQHALDMAGESRYIDKIIFDSEDEKMLQHALDQMHKYKLALIHKRKPELSEDGVSLYAPLKEVIMENPDYDIIIILQPDCPVKSSEFIDRCIDKFIEGEDRCKAEGTTFPFEDVVTFHNGMRTGSVRVISRDAFLSEFPTSKILAVEDRGDFVDIHSEENLKEANKNLGRHDTFQVGGKIKEPVQYNTHMIYNHICRYCKAAEMLRISRKDRVIDASCGQGYGSFILSLSANRVYGLDVNVEYIRVAKSYYNAENLHFCSYETFCLYEKPVDKIVFIETYEHVSKGEIEEFIDDLLGCLKKGGSMFLTAPIGEDGPSDYNKHHLNEPSLSTLHDVFRYQFEKIEITIDRFINSYGKDAEYSMMTMHGFKGGKE